MIAVRPMYPRSIHTVSVEATNEYQNIEKVDISQSTGTMMPHTMNNKS